MSEHSSVSKAAILLALVVVLLPVSALSQLTIFNIPSTDTLARGSFGIEADFIAKPVSFKDGGYQTYGYRAVYGVNNKTEVGANFFMTYDGEEAEGEVQFNAKRKIYSSEKHGVDVAAGTLISVPLRSSVKSSGIVYVNASKTVERFNRMRLTGGLYTAIGGGRDYGTKTGVMLGLEQPITDRVSFLADWFSGNNRLGYSAAGINVNLTKKQFILAGYNFGNYGRGNNALSAFYGYTF
jgi:hypothetical protein